MIEKFSWLHISDLHLKAEYDTWAQNIVLCEMVDAIYEQANSTIRPEFVIVSGDLAYAGLEIEYDLVDAFLKYLCSKIDVPQERVFIVPGNHDINRNVKTTCFNGARSILINPSAADLFLGNETEREDLLKRLSAYKKFEQKFKGTDKRIVTEEQLGFVESIGITELTLCIAGLNSAWLCNGGSDDDRKILIGERQIINIVNELDNIAPTMVLGILHHPPSWLCRYDETSFEKRFIPKCDILHIGHSHKADVSINASLSGDHCIVSGAGAAYEQRDFENTFSIITIDLASSNCEIKSFYYHSSSGHFLARDIQNIDIEIRSPLPDNFKELSNNIMAIEPLSKHIACYLAALLFGKKQDLPMVHNHIVLFVSPNVLYQTADIVTQNVTRRFLSLRNLLRAFPRNVAIGERISKNIDPLHNYVKWLIELETNNPELNKMLVEQNEQCVKLCDYESKEPYSMTLKLMDFLFEQNDWEELEIIARRHLNSSNAHILLAAKRKLAYSLANSDGIDKQKEAAAISEELARSPQGSINDAIVGATVYCNMSELAKAKLLAIESINNYPRDAYRLKDILKRIALETGDAELRRKSDELNCAPEVK
jgi:predicted phosphodiesterase